MLKNLNVLIMGGDARYLEVIKRLSSERATVFLAGFDQLKLEDPNIINSNLDKVDFSMIDVISIPVAGTNAKGAVEVVYSNNDIIVSKELMCKTPKHCITITGTSTPFLEDLSKSTNRKLITLFARDDIAILNSIATAEGVLGLAMELTDITVHGSHVIVLGFGRVGMTIARLFTSVGANVSVCVRKSADIARITEMGLTPIRVENVEQKIPKMDICINTIPYPVVDEKVISAMKKSALIIDITSDPGGTDFKFAKEQGVTALHALGLPGKTSPKSAGIIIADALVDLILTGDQP